MNDNQYDDFLSAIAVGCVLSIVGAWIVLDDLDDDGLTFTEWLAACIFGLLGGLVVARVGYVGVRWIDRRWFGGEDD